MHFDELVPMFDAITGAPTYEELKLLYQVAMRTPPDGVMVELGCDQGKSTSVLASIAKAHNLEFYTVDSFVYEPYAKPIFEANMKKYHLDKSYVLLEGDSGKMADLVGEIDLLFMDGEHSPHGVTRDCEAWLPKLKSGGYLLFHDYNDPTYTAMSAVLDSFVGGWGRIQPAFRMAAWRKP